MNWPGRYIEIDGEPVLEPDLLIWAAWYEKADRHVLRDEVGKILISTVFLGSDFNFMRKESPILYETMIFGGEHDGDCQRYATRTEAMAGTC